MMKNEKGITLVALVITVIILVIIVLVTVDISVDKELIDTAENATIKYENSVVLETLKTILVSERSLYDDGFIDEDAMWDNIKDSITNNEELNKNGTPSFTEGTGFLTVTIGTKQYKITIDKVTEI